MTDPIIFSSIGNYRIINYNSAFKDVNRFRGWIIETSGEVENSSYLLKEFRWSTNNSNWSLWMPLLQENIDVIELDPAKEFYVEFKFTANSDEDSSPYFPEGTNLETPIVLENFDVDLVYREIDYRDLATKPAILCSKELYTKSVIFNPTCTDKLFKPYDVNKGINVYQDLSRTVNELFGHEINYYSIQPNGRGKDVILKEYSLFDVVAEKCVKVMVPGNNFPDNKPIYDTFGIQFEQPLEIHIDRKYFESIFGKGAAPRKRDIIFFPLTNRIYQIESTYLHRDFNLYPVFFKCQLMKYEVKQNTQFLNPVAEKELHDYTVNTKDLFGEETQDEIEKVTKKQQYFISSQRRSEDPTRAYIDHYLPIIEFDLNNNYTIVFNSYYDLERYLYDDPLSNSKTEEQREAVRYKSVPILGDNDELSFTCWFKTRNYIDKTKLVNRPSAKLSISSYVQGSGTITYSSSTPHKLTMADGYVSILADSARSGGFKILSIPDQYSFRVADNGSTISGSIATWKFQKAQARNLIYGRKDGNGISIQMIWSGSNLTPTSTEYLQTGSFRILINNLEILSPFGAGTNSPIGNFIPTLDDWYGFVFNFSNIFKQYSVNVWQMLYDPENPDAQTSDLGIVHFKEGLISQKYTYEIPSDIEQSNQVETWKSDNNSYKILGSPLYLTNLRIFQNMIEKEKQSAILNQNVVGDSQLAIIIDNAKPVLKLPKIAKNR
jgi:hypothetical protein